MSGWRWNGQEEYLSHKTLYKITFPAFWEAAYKDKNAFFRKIERYAQKHIEKTNRGHEFPEGEKIQHFWHEHCEFCREKALTDKTGTFYCTEDMDHWICEECFRDNALGKFVAALGRIRQSNKVLSYGDYKPLRKNKKYPKETAFGSLSGIFCYFANGA